MGFWLGVASVFDVFGFLGPHHEPSTPEEDAIIQEAKRTLKDAEAWLTDCNALGSDWDAAYGRSAIASDAALPLTHDVAESATQLRVATLRLDVLANLTAR